MGSGGLITHDMLRLTIAFGVGAFVALVCLWAVRQGRRKTPAGTVQTLVLYASQTGQAEAIARRTLASLTRGHKQATLLSLRDVTPDILQQAERIVCVVSTSGEGEAPDEAAAFERIQMRAPVRLTEQSFAVLALGDRSHGHFCAFGHRLDDWLKACGAVSLRPCLEVDDLDVAALAEWDNFLSTLGAHIAASAGSGERADGEVPFAQWTLKDRAVLNPDSRAQKLVRIDLVPTAAQPVWQAGDLAEVLTPRGHRRSYSIASLPFEGHLRLFVRKIEGGDGSTWLTDDLQPGTPLKLRIKRHDGFRAPPGKGPLLLIGAGSGLAGLRAHMLEAQAASRPCWLIYGERNPVTDGALCDELIKWHETGMLSRLDLAFSTVADGDAAYVQDVLKAKVRHAAAWLWGEGSVMVCGGLEMGKAIEATLRAELGDPWADEAIAKGRYRRDLY